MGEAEVHSESDSVRRGLPPWVYHDPAFFVLERERIFRRSWQVACHVSDVPDAGDHFVFDLPGISSILVVRDGDGTVRAFHNFCRHRAARLVDTQPACPHGRSDDGLIRCPYHAWTYDLAGHLVALPDAGAYPGLDRGAFGLVPVETEIWLGFVFVRMLPGGPSVATMMKPYTDELRPYRFEDMRPLGRVTLRPREVNWKAVTDNYIDGLHIAVAHPGLRRVTGRSYRLVAGEHVQHMHAEIRAPANAGWSERLYDRFLPPAAHLPAERRRLWAYYMMWPNTAFDVYPEQIDFMQMLPVSPTQTLIREIAYALPDSSREARAARYLNWRINRVVNAEDHALISRVQHGLASDATVAGPLSDREVCLAAFAERMRAALPVCALPQAPPPDEMNAACRELAT